jgi:3-deoxy-7-phosphoheptulonate synthase
MGASLVIVTSAAATTQALVHLLTERHGVTPRLLTPTALLTDDRDDVAATCEAFGGAEVHRQAPPWPLASTLLRQAAPMTIAPGVTIGGNALLMMAGPCAVESAEQIKAVGDAVVAAGARAIRGGAFKPRTSPYSFQGLGRDGLALLAAYKARTGTPIVTEVLDTREVAAVAEVSDVLQVGARNMQNTALLRAVGDTRRPVLLKRGFGATVDELLHSAEYILAAGNERVMLCERGIRTLESCTRFTLDVGGIAWLKQRTHLPIVVDPSHAAGRNDLVLPLALAGVVAGADGLLVEVHDDPASARSDGEQALNLQQFSALMKALAPVAVAVGRSLFVPASVFGGTP